MYPGGICPERLRLLSQLANAITAHAEIVGKLVDIAGTNAPAEFEALSQEAGATSAVAQHAWNAYHRHVDEHRCE